MVNLRVRLPCHETDPRARLRAIARVTESAKRGGRIATAAAGTRALPAWLIRAIVTLTFSRWHIDLLASNVRGSRRPLAYEGVPMTGMVPLGFIPRRHPLAAFLVSYLDHTCIGFATDPALPEGDGLCRLWEQALDELDALGDGRG